MTRALLLLLLALGSGHASTSACCMLPVTYEGTIRQQDHEAVIIHHRDRQELVLRINYRITGETMPDRFAWVVTVPNEPDSYKLADATLFKDLFELAKKLKSPARPAGKKGGFGGGGGSFGDSGVELGKHAEVGPYNIQPVRGVGPNALRGLNAWLKANGFPTEDPEHMKYFVDRDFTFLCIKVAAPKGEAGVRPGGFLPPLHLSLASPRAYYPLRFSSRQGVFNVNLHLLTAGRLRFGPSGPVLRQINWSRRRSLTNHELTQDEMPESLKKVLQASKVEWKKEVWRYHNLRGYRVNQDNAIAGWRTDIFFNGVPRKYSAAYRKPETRTSSAGAERLR